MRGYLYKKKIQKYLLDELLTHNFFTNSKGVVDEKVNAERKTNVTTVLFCQ